MIDRRTPCRSSGTAIDVEPAAAVADEDLELTVGDLCEDIDPRCTGVPGRVDHRLACRRYERRGPRIDRAVPDSDQLDWDLVGDLDLTDRLLQGGFDGDVGACRRVEQPAAQLAFLGARQLGDDGRVIGLTLDQRKCLQHRVVQMCGDVGAFLAANALGAFTAQLAVEPQRPRPEDKPETEHGESDRAHDLAEAGRTRQARLEDAEAERGDQQHGSDDDAQPGLPAT